MDVRERLATGTGPLEANRGREPVGVDEQQHKVGPTSELVIGDHDVLGGRGAMNEPVLRQGCRGEAPALLARSQSCWPAMWKMTLTSTHSRSRDCRPHR